MITRWCQTCGDYLPTDHKHAAPAPSLFDAQVERVRPEERFDGSTYEPGTDAARLTTQVSKVYACMNDGAWRSLGDIARAVECPEASISARLRDLRKPKFGGHVVERKRMDGGLHLYRIRLETAGG